MFSRWKRDVFGPPPASLKRKLRLESLDERVVPDGGPGDPPPTDPPQAGDPAAQTAQMIWAYAVLADGTVGIGYDLASSQDPSSDPTAFNSIYEPESGAIVSANASFIGTTTAIIPPATLEAGIIYSYNQTTQDWDKTQLPSGPALLTPRSGYGLTPLTLPGGSRTAWAVHPQECYLASTTQPPPATMLRPGELPPPPNGVIGKPHVVLPPGSVITVPGPVGPTTITLPAGGWVVVNPDGSYTVFPVGGNATHSGPSGSGTLAPGRPHNIPKPLPGFPPPNWTRPNGGGAFDFPVPTRPPETKPVPYQPGVPGATDLLLRPWQYSWDVPPPSDPFTPWYMRPGGGLEPR